MICFCVHPGAYGCYLCRPKKWVKIEYETCTVYVRKDQYREPTDPYMYYI